MTFKLRQKHINEFQNSGILKIKNFFNKEDIKNLKNNLIQKLRKKIHLIVILKILMVKDY